MWRAAFRGRMSMCFYPSIKAALRAAEDEASGKGTELRDQKPPDQGIQDVMYSSR